jgi:hypothetical protein
MKVQTRQNCLGVLRGQRGNFRTLPDFDVDLFYKQERNTQDGEQHCVEEILAV